MQLGNTLCNTFIPGGQESQLEELVYCITLNTPPDNMKTLSISFWMNSVATPGAILSSSSYRIIILPGLFFCSSKYVKENSRNRRGITARAKGYVFQYVLGEIIAGP